MPVNWPLVKFLFNVVRPSIPDLVKILKTLKQQHNQTPDMERKLAQQLEMIESLTQQLELIHHRARKALIAACLAGVLALLALGTVFLTR